MAGYTKKSLAFCARLMRHRGGAVALYVAVFAVAGVGAAGLAIDFGRVAVLKGQMQDAADARALAAAVQLDGRDGAIARATDVAQNAATHWSAFSTAGDMVSTVSFYSAIDPNLVATAVDGDAKFVQVVMQPATMNMLFQPVLSLVVSGVTETVTVPAAAIATPSPFICEAPPLMICDLGEINAADSLHLTANAGRQIRLKAPGAGGGSWAPGNFGLLSLPDGSSGAAAIEAQLAAVIPDDCFDIDVITATGVKINKIADAINARHDLPGNTWPYPAENVIDYPRDPDIIVDPDEILGNGNWNSGDYWTDKHAGGLPADLANPTRYQVYLYELGLEYGRDGRETFYPVTAAMPGSFTTVTPPAPDVPVAVDPADADDPEFDGVPSQAAASNGYARRLFKVAQLQCIAEGVKGKGTYPTDGNYVEVFLTESVKPPPDAAIYAEVVRSLSAANSPEFHANVRLVR